MHVLKNVDDFFPKKSCSDHGAIKLQTTLAVS